jgi:hypothetical protein
LDGEKQFFRKPVGGLGQLDTISVPGEKRSSGPNLDLRRPASPTGDDPTVRLVDPPTQASQFSGWNHCETSVIHSGEARIQGTIPGFDTNLKGLVLIRAGGGRQADHGEGRKDGSQDASGSSEGER